MRLYAGWGDQGFFLAILRDTDEGIEDVILAKNEDEHGLTPDNAVELADEFGFGRQVERFAMEQLPEAQVMTR